MLSVQVNVHNFENLLFLIGVCLQLSDFRLFMQGNFYVRSEMFCCKSSIAIYTFKFFLKRWTRRRCRLLQKLATDMGILVDFKETEHSPHILIFQPIFVTWCRVPLIFHTIKIYAD